MSKQNQVDNDPERTLVTLEQLSQTIEVMTSVVNRLRQHLSEQLQAKLAEQKELSEAAPAELEAKRQPDESQENVLAQVKDKAPDKANMIEAKQQQPSEPANRESFVVEIRQQEPEPVRKNDKTLH